MNPARQGIAWQWYLGELEVAGSKDDRSPMCLIDRELVLGYTAVFQSKHFASFRMAVPLLRGVAIAARKL
jgi:hypothetical protein